MWRTNSIEAALCFEYFETPSCQPPTVPTDGPFAPCGSTVTLNLPFTGVVWLAEYAYGQFRMNIASPAANTLRAPSSSNEVTPRGVILPTCWRIASRIWAAVLLLIVTLPLSMKWPPPVEATHSSASQVRPSSQLP